MKRILFATGSALALALLLTLPVLAGGWAVVTLDELPGTVTAGEPLEIGFMVRQHGRTPLSGLEPKVNAHLTGTGEFVTVLAEDEGQVGHYVAVLPLDQTGEWEWSIDVFGRTQQFPALTVVATAKSPQVTQPAAAPQPAFNPMALIIAAVGVIGVAVGLLAVRGQKRWAVLLLAAGFLIGGYGVVFAANQPRVEEAAPEVRQADPASSESQVEMGRKLFVVKGCVSCHIHNEVRGHDSFGMGEQAPNLTNFTASPEYLRLWLVDPQTVKPAAKMPALGLSEAEIEALIAFINAD